MKHTSFTMMSILIAALLLTWTAAFPQTNFWQQTNGPFGGNITCIAINPSGHIFVGTEGGGIFRSTDNGNNWLESNTGLNDFWILTLAIKSNGDILAGNHSGVFRSTDNGGSWVQINTGLTNTDVRAIAIHPDGALFAGSYGAGIFRSTNNGNNWMQVNSGVTKMMVLSISASSNGSIFMGTDSGAIYRSTNNGDNWSEVWTGASDMEVRCLVSNSTGAIFSGTGRKWDWTDSGGVYRSTDNGENWIKLNTGSPLENVSSLAIDSNGHVFAGTNFRGVYRSADSGNTWTQINTGIFNTNIWSLASFSNLYMFVGTQGDGMYRSTNSGDTWSQINDGLRASSVDAIVINHGGLIFAGTSGGGAFTSTDDGVTWSSANTGLLRQAWVLALAINSAGDVFAGCPAGVFRTTNRGTSWTQINGGLINTFVYALTIDSSGNIFAGTQQGDIYRSTNNGNNWTRVATGLTRTYVSCFAIEPSGHILAGTGGVYGWRDIDTGKVYRSTNGGDSWTRINDGWIHHGVNTLAVNQSGEIFAGTIGEGLYRSTNEGVSWEQVSSGLTSNQLSCLAMNLSGVMFAGTWDSRVYRSTDNGENWTEITSGINNKNVWAFAINRDGYIFAGTFGGGVYRSSQPTVTRSILGTKFNDLNGNGIKDGGESGLQNWRIRLIKDGVQVDSTLTNSSGSYMFSNLSAATYTVREKLDSGWVQTAPPGGEYSGIVVTGDTVVTGKDFGNMQVGSISGVKFNDLNGDGIKDGGEPGLPNWRIRLVRNSVQVDSTLTNSNGSYMFSNLPLGTYTIREKLDSGWIQTAPPSGEYVYIVISRDTAIIGKDFGNMQGSISGVKFNDLNRNSIKDGGEPGLPNWRIRLNGSRTDSVLTNASGYYSFTNMGPGTYTVSEATQLTWEQTLPATPGTYTITISPGQGIHTEKDFGNYHEPLKVKLTLTIHDASNSIRRNLNWGVRRGATYGIWQVDPQATAVDSAEDEYEIPAPISGIFDARFSDPRGTSGHFGDGSWTDIRDFLDVTQVDTYMVKFQPGTAGYPITFIWSKELVNHWYGGSVALVDSLGNTFDMKTTDSLVITNPSITDILLIAYRPQLPYMFLKGWNLLSIPYQVTDGRKTVLFPTASSYAFMFDPTQGYWRRDTLSPGEGYWLKFPEPVEAVSIVGDPRTLDTLDVAAGWNLIGSLSSPVDTGSVATIPVGIISGNFFGYNRGYYIADSLEPLRGYWVKMSEAGKLVMSASGAFVKRTPQLDPLQGINKLTIQDAGRNNQSLYFGSGWVDLKGFVSYRYELPPIPPTGVFDVRFASGGMAEIIKDGKSGEFPIQISGAEYPIMIDWSINPRAVDFLLKVGSKVVPLELNGSVQITDPNSSIVLKLNGISVLPEEFTLEQNYPNPFNPVTVIRYSLPVESKVNLKFYNVLGQEVATLVNEKKEAGRYEAEFNGSKLPSGVYFYRLQAGSYVETKKLVMLK